ncbi:hypothetical protein CGLO_17739 [Colletotrichum gloeosporioides Cg-14]|jgi:hypothetical protein
MSGI